MLKPLSILFSWILAMFSFVIANAYDYTAKITDNTDLFVSSGIWYFVGVELFVLGIGLALGFIIHSHRKGKI